MFLRGVIFHLASQGQQSKKKLSAKPSFIINQNKPLCAILFLYPSRLPFQCNSHDSAITFHSGGIPLPGRGIVGQNQSARSKTTVRSKRGFPIKSGGGPFNVSHSDIYSCAILEIGLNQSCFLVRKQQQQVISHFLLPTFCSCSANCFLPLHWRIFKSSRYNFELKGKWEVLQRFNVFENQTRFQTWDKCLRNVGLTKGWMNVTSFSSISYFSNSEYWTQKRAQSESIHSTILDVHVLKAERQNSPFLSVQLKLDVLDSKTTTTPTLRKSSKWIFKRRVQSAKEAQCFSIF